MIKNSLPGIASFSLCLATVPANAQLPETSCKVSMAQYTTLKTGMSYDEARGMLGCDGIELSSSEMPGFKTIMFMWTGAGGLGANMNAMFQNDKLQMKSQFGLR
jgi:hypothetical protein